MRLEKHLRPCTLHPTKHETDDGLPYQALYLKYGSKIGASVAMTKLKDYLDVFGLNYEIMRLSGGKDSEENYVTVCTTNPAVMALAELADWFGGYPVNDFPTHLNVESGVPALKFQPGMN